VSHFDPKDPHGLVAAKIIEHFTRPEFAFLFAKKPCALPPPWQPMDSAPREGTRILVLVRTPFKGYHELAEWDDDKYANRPAPYWRTTGARGTREQRVSPPEAWMPLPAIPDRVQPETL